MYVSISFFDLGFGRSIELLVGHAVPALDGQLLERGASGNLLNKANHGLIADCLVVERLPGRREASTIAQLRHETLHEVVAPSARGAAARGIALVGALAFGQADAVA